MAVTECPDCGKYFAGTRCECGYQPAAGQRAWHRPAWMDQPPPCTAEENERAAQNVQAVLNGEISLEQAQRVLHAIFQGREREL